MKTLFLMMIVAATSGCLSTGLGVTYADGKGGVTTGATFDPIRQSTANSQAHIADRRLDLEEKYLDACIENTVYIEMCRPGGAYGVGLGLPGLTPSMYWGRYARPATVPPPLTSPTSSSGVSREEFEQMGKVVRILVDEKKGE